MKTPKEEPAWTETVLKYLALVLWSWTGVGGDKEKRGREVYGRREKMGREAGFPSLREAGEKMQRGGSQQVQGGNRD